MSAADVFINYDGLWGTCLLVGFLFGATTFVPLGCFRSSQSPSAELVFSQISLNFQSYFPVCVAGTLFFLLLS